MGGMAGTATSELTEFAENGDETFNGGKALAKTLANGLVQSVVGGMGDGYGSALEECGADTTTKLLWYGINDLKNQNLLGETTAFAVDKIIDNNECPNDNN